MPGRLNDMSPEQFRAYINDDIGFSSNLDSINNQIEMI
jgi:hypothetical protein